MQSNKIIPRFSALEYGLILLCFSVCLTGALLLPTDQGPDEAWRLLLTEGIVKTGTLPTGDELEVMIPGWGFSYALYPYLYAIVGRKPRPAAALTLVWLALFVWACLGTMTKMLS